MVLRVNERVMAKWPGSALWFEGTVVDFNDKEYQVRFDDEGKSEYVLKYRDVRSYDSFHRTSRSRSRGRSKSKGRTTRRTAKAKVEEESKEEVKKVVNAESPEPVKEIKRDSPKPVARLTTEDNLGPRTSTPTRQSLRIAALNEKNALDGQINNVNAKPAVVETNAAPQPSLGSRMCAGVTCIGTHLKSGILKLVPSLGTVLTAPLMVVLLALPLVLNRTCTKKTCTVMEFPVIPMKLSYYYDLNAVVLVAAFIIVQLLLGLIPLGRKLELPNGAVLRCNGYLSVLVSLALIPALMYFKVDVLAAYRLYEPLLATLTLFTILEALLLYIRARSIPDDAKNPSGNSGRFLVDLFVGRETLPTVAGVDLKYFLFRSMGTILLLLNVVMVIKDLDTNKGQYSPTLLVAAILQIFAAVDMLWFEESFSTTYEYSRLGCGFFFVHSTLVTPFIYAIYTRVVLNHRSELEWYFLSLIAAVNLIGYTLYRGAYSQMHAFRKNPSDPALAHLESLPTSAGTRLLVSGWWGVVRHPNYLGYIIVQLSWALLCGFNFGLPWVLLGLSIIAVVQRTFDVEKDAKRRYGTAWDSYTERVKSRLLPKVF